MPAAADRVFSVLVRVNGSEDKDFYKCVQRVVVNEDLDRGASFEIGIGLCRNDDGSWPHIDDPNLRPWNRVTIVAAFPGRPDTIFDGYISHVRVSSDQRAGSVSLHIRGVDASYAMNLEEKCKVWTDKTYEQIAREIIEDVYQLRPVLPPAAEAGGEPPAVTQRATDHRFLRELARRKGYEFFVRGAEVHFHPADLTGTPQKVIATHFGEETNCDNIDVDVDGTMPTEAVMQRFDPVTGETTTETATSSGLPTLGTEPLSALRGHGLPQRRILVRRQGAASPAQQAEYVAGLLRRHGWWIKASGTVNGLKYGQVLRSKKLVTIKGLGATHNGNYYVRKVTHTLGPRTYDMAFEAARNGLGKLGSEDFTAERPDAAAAVPLAAGAGADPEAVTVLESGPQVLPA
jgi:phage protein D